MLVWVFLVLAIVAEVTATMALKASAGFTKLGPTILVAVGYSLAFYLLALVLRSMPVGVAYAIWAGLGIVLTAVFGLLIFGQRLDLATLIGMMFIITGIIIMQLFAKTSLH